MSHDAAVVASVLEPTLAQHVDAGHLGPQSIASLEGRGSRAQGDHLGPMGGAFDAGDDPNSGRGGRPRWPGKARALWPRRWPP